MALDKGKFIFRMIRGRIRAIKVRTAKGGAFRRQGEVAKGLLIKARKDPSIMGTKSFEKKRKQIIRNTARLKKFFKGKK